MTFNPTTGTSGWDPLTGAIGTATFTATANRDDKNVRTAVLVLLDPDAGTTYLGTSGGQTGPQYQVLQGAAVVSKDSTGTPPTTNAVTQFTFRNDNGSNGASTNTPSFTVRIIGNAPNANYVSNMFFSETPKYSTRCFTNDGTEVGTTLGVASGPTITVTVPSKLSITSSGPYNVNFQSFTSTSASVNVELRSTGMINATVSTANGSQLVLAGAVTPYPANSVIPYTISLNGIPLPTGPSPTTLARAGMAAINWPLTLSLTGGLPSGKVPGSYGDTITLTLTPGT